MYARGVIKGGAGTAISTALKMFGIRCFHNSPVAEKNETKPTQLTIEKVDMNALLRARAEQARLLGLTSQSAKTRMQKLYPGSVEARQELESRMGKVNVI